MSKVISCRLALLGALASDDGGGGVEFLPGVGAADVYSLGDAFNGHGYGALRFARRGEAGAVPVLSRR